MLFASRRRLNKPKLRDFWLYSFACHRQRHEWILIKLLLFSTLQDGLDNQKPELLYTISHKILQEYFIEITHCPFVLLWSVIVIQRCVWEASIDTTCWKMSPVEDRHASDGCWSWWTGLSVKTTNIRHIEIPKFNKKERKGLLKFRAC